MSKSLSSGLFAAWSCLTLLSVAEGARRDQPVADEILGELARHARFEDRLLEDGSTVRTFVLRGINLQLVNGLGDTLARNGSGNLIVGYNAPADSGGLRASGSHNILCGDGLSFTACAGLLLGEGHSVERHYSAAIAGRGHTVQASHGVSVGGLDHVLKPTGAFGAVLGGQTNTVFGVAGTAAGGSDNYAQGSYSTCVGGRFNDAHVGHSTVTRGEANIAGGRWSVVSGGLSRMVGSDYDWAAGSLFEDF